MIEGKKKAMRITKDFKVGIYHLKVSKIFYFSVSYKMQRRQWHPTPVLLPGKSHGWRSLVGCCPWGREESDTTERLHFHMHWRRKRQPTPVFLPGESRDSGAWWAAVYGITQSWTRLKQLSSSSRELE